MTVTSIAPEAQAGAIEPVLATREIQGNVIPGFDRDRQALVFVEIDDADTARRWLTGLRLTSAADVIGAAPPAGATWTNLVLSYRGLTKICHDADRMMDMPYKRGLAARAGILGDPPASSSRGHPSNWVIGRPDQRGLDVMLIVAADDDRSVDARIASIATSLSSGLELVHVERGSTRRRPDREHEHFGYRDNISQPGVRGRLSGSSADLLTSRTDNADPDHGLPGQRMVWPGEFVYGYPGQDALDCVRPGPIAVGGPPWTVNGSLLVVRRLLQDVDGFHRFLDTTAAELATRHPKLAGLTPERLAAMLMGRWQSGAPIMITPEHDDPALGADPLRRNDFRYGASGDAAAGGGDLDELLCPRAAHARRAYPRAALTPSLSEASIETHRILRRGIPFHDVKTGERGLLFLAYQTSIERQFEHITRAWLNNPHLHAANDGHDPIVGQAFGAEGDRGRRFTLHIRDEDGTVDRVQVAVPNDWVTPTGGGYFFVPALGMLKDLAP